MKYISRMQMISRNVSPTQVLCSGKQNIAEYQWKNSFMNMRFLHHQLAAKFVLFLLLTLVLLYMGA